jgi:hypothetical protein
MQSSGQAKCRRHLYGADTRSDRLHIRCEAQPANATSGARCQLLVGHRSPHMTTLGISAALRPLGPRTTVINWYTLRPTNKNRWPGSRGLSVCPNLSSLVLMIDVRPSGNRGGHLTPTGSVLR